MCRQQPPAGPTRRDPYKYPYRGHGPHWTTQHKPTITGRKRGHHMCTTGGGEGGHKTKRQAARWYEEQAAEAEREQRQSPWRDWTGIILERLVGHAFADVIRRRMSLRAWARYELTPTAHQPNCRWARLYTWLTRIETADGRIAALDGGPGPQPT